MRATPSGRTGGIDERACPFNTLYWNFLLRCESLLTANQRMTMRVRRLARLDDDERASIRAQAAAYRAEVGARESRRPDARR